MSRQRHDHLAKYLFAHGLDVFGTVVTNRSVPAEERSIDVVGHAVRAAPHWRRTLGLLGRMAHGWTAIEAYRNPVTAHELRACEAKAANLEAELARKARRRNAGRRAREPVHLWVITPTLSVARREGFRLQQRPGWPSGVLDSGEWGLVVVVIHELPVTRSTLYLRLAGRDAVQDRALADLRHLPSEDPLRRLALPGVIDFVGQVRSRGYLSAEQKEFLMKTLPFYEELKREMLLRGKAEGKAEAKAEGKAEDILTVLQARGLRVPARLRSRVRATSSQTQLDRLLRRAVRVESAADLFR